ncbi:PQQ-binding-like beta-propeller repeat protein [Krasilnikovia sp. MM14-A1259]|uniref:outer membrane protein assembly factor BamB family protein n=1 Tax=Krasilnikovia sp. MM14-A1259 TaxID=3373539 RepID=UPI00382D6591
MKSFRIFASAVAMTVVFSGAAEPAEAGLSSDWPQPGYDAGHSYYNPNETIVNTTTIKTLKLRWQATPTPSDCPGIPGQLGPIVAGGPTLTEDNTGLIARDSMTGHEVWKADDFIADHLASNLIVSGSTVIVTTPSNDCVVEGSDHDGFIEAFDLATGNHLWHAVDATDASDVIVTDGMVIVCGFQSATDPLVSAYRLSDGKLAWSDASDDEGRTLVSMIPVNHQVIVRDFGVPVMRDVLTGAVRGYSPTTWLPLAVTPNGDRVIVGDYGDWTLKVVRVSDRSTLWSMDRVSNRIATDGRRIYMGIGSNLEAYDLAGGKQAWSVKLGGRVGQPVRAGGMVYAAVAGKPVAIRNASSGAKIKPNAALSRVTNVAAVGGGHLYAISGSRIDVFAP